MTKKSHTLEEAMRQEEERERAEFAAMMTGRGETPHGMDEGEDNPDLYHLTRGGNRRGYHRLRIIRNDGSAFSVLYGDVHTLEMTADGTRLTLLLKNGLAVTLTGERLTALADYLEEQHVRRVYVYDPAKHHFKEGIARERIPVIHDITEDMPPFRGGAR